MTRIRSSDLTISALLVLVIAAAQSLGGCRREAAVPESAGARATAAPPAPTAQRPAASVGTPAVHDFPAFWAEFRQAILADDVARLAAMTRFPLEVRGESDRDPVVTKDEAQLGATLSQIMAQDSGMRAEEETVRQFIERTTAIGANQIEPDGNAARIGDFVFERTEDRWRLVRLYAREPL